MMIDRRRQVRNSHRWSAGSRLSLTIVETDYCILVRHVEVVSQQRQAIGCVQVLGEDCFFFVSPIAIGVAQQRQSIAAGDVACPFRFDDAGYDIFRSELRFGASSTLGNQNISIWKNEGLAWNFEVG